MVYSTAVVQIRMFVVCLTLNAQAHHLDNDGNFFNIFKMKI